METILSGGSTYEVTGHDENGRINGLSRFNSKTKMRVNLSFSNNVDIDKVDRRNAELLGNQKHFMFKK